MIAIPDPHQQDPPDTQRTVIVHSEMGTLRGSNDWMNLREARMRNADFAAVPAPPLASPGPPPWLRDDSYAASRGMGYHANPDQAHIMTHSQSMSHAPQHQPVMHHTLGLSRPAPQQPLAVSHEQMAAQAPLHGPLMSHATHESVTQHRTAQAQGARQYSRQAPEAPGGPRAADSSSQHSVGAGQYSAAAAPHKARYTPFRNHLERQWGTSAPLQRQQQQVETERLPEVTQQVAKPRQQPSSNPLNRYGPPCPSFPLCASGSALAQPQSLTCSRCLHGDS